jgi:glutamate/tyrosine decarboxylase-like PLP-dependent enzyme
MLRFTSSSAITVTLPSGLVIGFFVVLAQEGVGQITAIAGAGASVAAVDGAVKTGGQYAAMVAVCVAANTWRIYNGVP